MADDDRTHWAGMLLPALTFVVGLALGGALLYAFTGGSEDEVVEAEPTPSATASSADTVVTLPAACEMAAEKVTEAYSLLRQAVSQVRDFQADELVETLNRLEDVDGETRPLAQECSEVSVTTSPAPESSAAGEPSDEESQ